MCGFIKEWIENWKEDKKRNSEIENPGNMSDLLKIVAMKDPKYVKEFIEYNEEILKECHINGDRAVDLIKTVGDPEYIKECLGNVEKMKALDINGDRAVDLIKTVGDPEYIKECLGNVEKMKALDINGDRAVDLIKTVGDPEYIKEYLENVEKMQALDIYGGKVTELLTVEELEPKYIEEWLENIERMRALKIQDFIAADLIKKVEQKIPGYIKKCLENVEKMQALNIYGDRAVDLIKTVGDPEYIKECLENQEKRRALSIKGNSTAMLIITVEEKEPGYIKECLENVEKMQALGIDSYVMESLITATKDIVYIKKLLKNKEKMQALGIKDDGVYILMKTVEDPEYIKECLGNKEPGYIKEYIKNQIKDEKNNELGSDFLAQVIMMTGDAEFINDCRVNNDLNPETRDLLDRFTKIPPITLPGQMTIGVEIESEGSASRKEIADTMKKSADMGNWELKDDGSLTNGIEVVSPILRSSGTSIYEIYRVCSTLYSLGQTTSERCGGHIHIGADYLTDLQDWKNLRTIWNNTEKILYVISNRKGEIPRAGVLGYAQPISGKDESKQKTINLENESNLENFIAETKIIQGTRYSGINYVNVGEEEKNTIEFRLPNGTLDPTTWIENINLFGGLVRVSHELSKIMLKSAEQRTEEEKKMLYNYKVIQTEQDERKVAEALIGLCVSQEQMQTYLDRYDENSELLEKTPKINDGLKGQIRKNKIGKKTIPKINGVDLEEFSREVSKELEIINEREGESIDVK